MAPGQTVITAAVKNTTGTQAVEVVPTLSGVVTMMWTATDCSQHNAGCAGRTPWVYAASVTVTQVGSRIDGTWGRLSWMTGSVPFSGRIRADGSMDLSGARCSLDDIGRGTLFTLTDWRMQREADGVYRGRARHIQENDCNGRASSRLVTDYVVQLRP